MGWFLLLYDVVPDYLERRGAFREEHLRLANEARARGELALAGATQDDHETFDGAVLAFTIDDPAIAARFAEADPYVKNGLVTRWRVRKWNVVIGAIP